MNPPGPVLRDIHLPSAAWWPPAPGWWLLTIVLVVLVACFGWWLKQRAQRRPLAAALREVDRLAEAFRRDGDAAALADGASRLLRRVARMLDPAAASNNGETWRGFVRAGARDAGARNVLDDLLEARFRAQPQLDGVALVAAVRAWCKQVLRSGAKRRVRPRSRNTRIATPEVPPA